MNTLCSTRQATASATATMPLTCASASCAAPTRPQSGRRRRSRSRTRRPSASACGSQPTMIRLRMPSIRYETGFSVAAVRNQSISIRLRGMFIEEMNRKTNSTGKSPWTASPEPVRSAANAPSAPNASTIRAARNEQHDRAGAPGRQPNADRQADGEVDERLGQARDDDAAELAGQQRDRAHRRQREPVEEAGLDVAREVGAGVHRREQRALDERHREREGEERVGRESRAAASRRLSPPEFTASSISGKMHRRRSRSPAAAQVRMTERRASWAAWSAAVTMRPDGLGLASPLVLARRPRASGRSSRGRRRRGSARAASSRATREPLGVERAHDVGQLVLAVLEPHGDRPAVHGVGSPKRVEHGGDRAGSSGSCGTASTVGRADLGLQLRRASPRRRSGRGR